LDNVSLNQVKASYLETFRSSGKEISDSLARIAANASFGYPFLIQLIGYYIWRESGKNLEVTAENVNNGINKALKDLDTSVLETSINDLSKVDKQVLRIMLDNETQTSVSQISTLLKKTRQYTQTYVHRLISAGFVKRTSRGNIDFALPYFRDYLERDENQGKLLER
jgi:hypothetical protein